MKILAADDDPIILDLLVQLLSVVGQHEITTVASAEEVIEILSQNAEEAFDCFLLDISMLEMDGLDLARHIRRTDIYAFTPIVMLTALSQKRYIDDAFAAGATDYVTKPFDRLELTTRLRIIEQLVLSRKSHATSKQQASTLPNVVAGSQSENAHQRVKVQGIEDVIDFAAMEKYTTQLSRSSMFGSTVFAFGLRKSDLYCDTLTATNFRFLIQDVAKVITDTLVGCQCLMSYAGDGVFLCITRSGYRPDMAHLADQVNARLNHAHILSYQGDELHPRVSQGAAIRLAWKSGDQIPAALAAAQSTAKDAAIEYERLKTDFFKIGISA